MHRSPKPPTSGKVSKSKAAKGTATVAHLTAIIDLAPTAMVMIDHGGTIVLVNKEAETLFGYRRDELFGRTVEVLVPKEFRDRHPGLRSDFFLHSSPRRMGAGRDLFAVRKDGGEFPVEIGLNPIKTEEGLFVLSAIVDITERKRLEARFRATVESAPTAMVMIDKEGRIVLVNTETEKLFGYGREELLSRSVEILVPERFRGRHPKMRAQFFTSPEARRMGAGRDLFGLRKDGSEFPVEIGLNPIETEEGLFVLSAIVDITERKRNEAALKNSEERVRLIVNSSLDAVVTMDEQGTITGWNPQAEKTFGWERDEAMNRTLAELIIPEAFREAHRRGLERFLKTGEGPALNTRLELTALHRDSHTFPVELTISAILLGDRFEFSAFIRDITERKRLEAALRGANEQLEQRVQERTAQLERQTDELRQANEALENSNLELRQFAYIASHDLQSPLRSISGFVQLLQSEYQGKLGQQADDWIRRTVESSQQMQILIRDILVYSSVDARSRPFARIPFRAVFDDTVGLLQASIDDAGGRVTCDELPEVLGDRAQWVQVLQNLIGNALIYHGDKPPRVHVSAKRNGSDWVFAVRDNGIGIDSKYHERIFEIFRRLHHQQQYPGTGIGLAICRRVVHRHGGRIWVESSPGQGSTFYFTIPEREVNT